MKKLLEEIRDWEDHVPDIQDECYGDHGQSELAEEALKELEK